MPHTALSNPDALLMIGSALAEFTQSLELCEHIPHFLTNALNLRSLSMAVIANTSLPDATPTIYYFASSDQSAPIVHIHANTMQLAQLSVSSKVAAAAQVAAPRVVERTAVFEHL